MYVRIVFLDIYNIWEGEQFANTRGRRIGTTGNMLDRQLAHQHTLWEEYSV